MRSAERQHAGEDEQQRRHKGGAERFARRALPRPCPPTRRGLLWRERGEAPSANSIACASRALHGNCHYTFTGLNRS